MLDSVLSGFATIFSEPALLLIIVAGVAAGTAVGALPGLTATMAVALMVPVTFGMPAVAGLLMLIGIYIGAIYGGSIPAILIRTPGTPAAAATLLDGFELAKQGRAGKALSTSVIASFVGGTISALALTFIAPKLATFALRFSSPEYFALGLFGLTIIASISGDSLIKGLISGIFGMLLATIGMDPLTAFPRFTFGRVELLNGISFIPVLIGLFAISEALIGIENVRATTTRAIRASVELLNRVEIRRISWTAVKSALIGILIGIIPGAGAEIAAFVAYGEAKRSAKDPTQFGKGVLEGVAAPEAANNGVTGAALIPLLTLGIPGDAVAAVMLGALQIQGVRPGPGLFREYSELIYTLFAGFFIANIVMLTLGLLGARFFAQVLSVPKSILVPVIIILCIVGSYAVNNSLFDVWVMLFFGVIGYFMQKMRFPISPLVLGLILGPMVEAELRRSLLLSQGSPAIFVTRPVSLILLLLTMASIVQGILRQRRARMTPIGAK